MTDPIKQSYAQRHGAATAATARLNQRLLDTYRTIATRIARTPLAGHHLDLGSGDRGFEQVCRQAGINSRGCDYPEFDLENDPLPGAAATVDFITLNAVFEHLAHPGHLLAEIKRVLKPEGLLFIRTPNWQMDYRNFYNDPTHVKPYTPRSLRSTLQLAGFTVLFLEPGLVQKSWFWWRLPEWLKWRAAARLPGGTKSIIVMAKPG